MTIGVFTLAAFFIYLITVRFDWNKIAAKAKERSDKELQRQEDEKLLDKITNLEYYDNRDSLKESLLTRK